MMINRTFSSYNLKMIALVTMLIDHVGAAFIWRLISSGVYNDALYAMYQLTRYIGRMAFPIYCFLLVEGFLHTRSVGKYALRLGIFAILSEVPFDMAFNNSYWDATSNNVFLTLLIGLILIWGISFLEKFHEFWMEKKLDAFIGGLAAIAVGVLMVVPAMFVAEKVLYTDYGMAGVIAILVIYLFRWNHQIGFTLSVMALGIMLSNSSEYLALLMLYPISLYDGSRGGGNGALQKWLFYGFYPVHLLVLALLCIVCQI